MGCGPSCVGCATRSTKVDAGAADPAALRSFFNRITIRQNNWTLGAFCQSYCRAVTGHHSLEDSSVFPHLGQADARFLLAVRHFSGRRWTGREGS